jgi:hypothetical protein
MPAAARPRLSTAETRTSELRVCNALIISFQLFHSINHPPGSKEAVILHPSVFSPFPVDRLPVKSSPDFNHHILLTFTFHSEANQDSTFLPLYLTAL